MTNAEFFEGVLFLMSCRDDTAGDTVVLNGRDLERPLSSRAKVTGKKIFFTADSVESLADKALTEIKDFSSEKKSEEALIEELRLEIREDLIEELNIDVEKDQVRSLLTRCKEKLLLMREASELFVFSTGVETDGMRSDVGGVIQSIEDVLERLV